jgi:hypothetical protein
MQRWMRYGTCLLLWSLTWGLCSHALGAEPADAIPDTASLVVRFKSPKAALGKLAGFVDAVQPGLGNAVTSSLPGLGEVIGNSGLEGVDTEKDLWAVVFAQPQAMPLVVFIVTAKDVDDLKDGLPSNYEVHVSGKLVAYSEHEDALGEIRERLDGEGKALLSTIDAATKKLFDSADVSVLVNVKQLAEDFSDELDQAEPQLNAFIDQLVAALPEAQRPQLEPALGLYRVLGAAILNGIRDTESYALGVTFSKTAIRIEDRLQVEDGSSTADYFAKQAPGDLALMGKLPAGKPVYFGLKADMSSLIEWSMKLTREMLKGTSDDQQAKFDEAVAEMSKLKYEEMGMYLDIGKTAPAFRGGGVTLVTPGNKLRDISRKLLANMGKIESVGFTQTTKLEPAAEKIGGFEADRITIQQEFDESADPTGMQKKMHAIMFGEGGMEQLMVYQANRTLQTLGGKKEMQDLITAVEANKSPDAAFTAARKRFSDKLNLLALFDLAQIIQGVATLAADSGAIPIDMTALKGLKLDPAYVGFSITIEPTAARAQLEVPVQQVQNIMKIVSLVGPPR